MSTPSSETTIKSKEFATMLVCLLLLSLLILAGGPAYISAMNLGKTASRLWLLVAGTAFVGAAQQQFVFVLFGLVPAALLWLGAGIAGVLSRIQKKSRWLLLVFVCYASIPVLLLVGLTAVAFVDELFRGEEPVWKAMRPMPEPPQRIAAADYKIIYVETVSGNIYSCRIEQGDCWQPAREPLKVETFMRDYLQPSAENPPPGNAVSSLNLRFVGVPGAETSTTIRYAVLSDGSVWWCRSIASAFDIVVNPLNGLGRASGRAIETIILVLSAFSPLWLGGGTWWLSNRIWKLVNVGKN